MFLISLSACVHQVTREYFARKNYLKNAMSKLLVLIYLLAARNLGNNKNLSFIYIQLKDLILVSFIHLKMRPN
jgi:hypothetical protein